MPLRDLLSKGRTARDLQKIEGLYFKKNGRQQLCKNKGTHKQQRREVVMIRIEKGRLEWLSYKLHNFTKRQSKSKIKRKLKKN